MARFYVTEQLSEHIGETPEGFLLCRDVPLTRTGELLYKQNELLGEDGKPLVEGTIDGIVRIRRDEDEVFDENAIASFEGKPVTIDHPVEAVSPENWKEFAHGTVQNVRRGDGEMSDLLIGDILITTKEGKDLVQSGLREISLGYNADYEQIKKGRGLQRNIIGNHIALVTRGRAGSRCAIQDKEGVDENITTKEDMTKMRAKDLFKRIFPKSRFADALEDEDLGEPTSVEGTDEVEKAIAAAEEAKAAAQQAVEAAEKANEAAQTTVGGNESSELEEDDGEEVTTLEEISERLSIIENFIEDLMGEVEGEESVKDDDLDDEEEEYIEDDDFEEEEDLEEFQDVASDAEIIDPDFVATKPTGDSKKAFRNIKVKVLKRALTSDHAPLVYSLLKGKSPEKLKAGELNGVFVAASRLIGQTRDSKIQSRTMDASSYFKNANAEIKKMAERNKEFWNKQ